MRPRRAKIACLWAGATQACPFMTRILMELPFRGQRTYLHGTDLYNAVTSVLVDQFPHLRGGRVAVNFHTLLQKQPDLLVGAGDLDAERARVEYRGEFVIGDGEQAGRALILESNREVTRRILCPEDRLMEKAQVDPATRRASMEPADATPIENLVALTKKLHLTVLPELSRKWLFVRLMLARPLPAERPRHMEVRLQGVMGDRMTRCGVWFDNELVGTIFFCTPT